MSKDNSIASTQFNPKNFLSNKYFLRKTNPAIKKLQTIKKHK